MNINSKMQEFVFDAASPADTDRLGTALAAVLPDGAVVKARELSGVNGMMFIRHSQTGVVEARVRTGSWGGLNEAGLTIPDLQISFDARFKGSYLAFIIGDAAHDLFD